MRNTALTTAVVATAAALYWHFRASSPTEERRDVSAMPVTAPAAATAAPEPIAPPVKIDETPAPGLSNREAEIVKAIHARFATGDFVGALKLADQHLTARGTSEGLHGWIMSQMPALLTSAGWTRLRLGDCEEAIAFFLRADVIKKSPEATKGLALCHYKQKNFVSAREHFDAFLEKNPNDHQMQILLTDVLESEGRYDQAVRILEKTVATIEDTQVNLDEQGLPDLNVLKNRLKGMRTKANVSKLQATEASQNFRLSYSAGDHEDLVSFVLTSLEDALDEYIETYGFSRPLNHIEVILYDAGNFRSVVAGGPEWAEGIFDGRMRIPVRSDVATDTGKLRTILRHELAHALNASLSDHRSLPPWFEEGLAQKLSCPAGDCGSFRFPPTPGGFLPEKSFATSYISLESDKASRAYRQSLYLIYVLQRLRGSDALRQVISGITTSSDNSANGILRPANITFAELHAEAARLWEREAVLP